MTTHCAPAKSGVAVVAAVMVIRVVAVLLLMFLKSLIRSLRGRLGGTQAISPRPR